MPVSARGNIRAEQGFTLIELLVTALLGIIVLLGAFNVFDSGLRASANVQDRTEVVQRGRTAMEQLTQELRSQTCLGPGYPAITYGDGNTIIFYANFGTGFAPEQRRLIYSPSADTLTEYSYQLNGTLPNVTPAPSPYRTRLLLTNATPSNSDQSFFHFYAFTGQDPITPSALLSVPLSSGDAARTVQIVAGFVVHPIRGRQNDRVATTFENQVYARTADPTDPVHSPQCI